MTERSLRPAGLRGSRLCFIFAVLIMILIFCFSAQPAEESQEISDGILYLLLSGQIPILSQIVLATHIFEILPIRKCAHATVYFLLGSFWSAGFHLDSREKNAGLLPSLKERWAFCTACSWILSFFYACTDEFHQLFVSGRSGEFRDVCIDSAGALVGIILITLAFEWKRRRILMGRNLPKNR